MPTVPAPATGGSPGRRRRPPPRTPRAPRTRPAGRPGAAPRARAGGDRDEHDVGEGAPEVPAEARREAEDDEPVEVLQQGRPRDERQPAAGAGRERPERQVEQEPVGEARERAVAGERATSAFPRARGRRPAPIPTHAAPSIWKGSHGPTPPVMRADAKSVTAPWTNPNPAPKTRPPRTRRKKTVSSPAVPAPSGRRAAPTAESTPSIATALTSIPPSAISARTTASSSGRTRAKTSGASAEWARPDDGSTSSGQPNATSPARLTSATATVERGRIRMARPGRASAALTGHPPGARSGRRRRSATDPGAGPWRPAARTRGRRRRPRRSDRRRRPRRRP